jgi:hypothetical protein
LKFSDVILAVATINVISVLIMVVLYALLISPLGSTWGMNSASNAYYAAWTKETLQSMFQTGSWTNLDWFAYAQLALVVTMALNVALALVLIFVSVYAGSMLRKPKNP